MDIFFISRKLKKISFSLAVTGFLFFLLCGVATATCSETFSWAPNTESNITGYKIYYGTADNGPYPNFVNVSSTALVNGRIQGTVVGLVCGQQYYFVCVAVNSANLESAYSTQAAVIPIGGIPGVITDLSIIEISD